MGKNETKNNEKIFFPIHNGRCKQLIKESNNNKSSPSSDEGLGILHFPVSQGCFLPSVYFVETVSTKCKIVDVFERAEAGVSPVLLRNGVRAFYNRSE